MRFTPLDIVVVAFAAIAVGLTVRYINLPKNLRKRTVRIAIAVAIPILYPLSAGPFVVLSQSPRVPNAVSAAIGVISPLYAPIFWMQDRGPEPCKSAVTWYIHFWIGYAGR